jgi:hypothetical protein
MQAIHHEAGLQLDEGETAFAAMVETHRLRKVPATMRYDV